MKRRIVLFLELLSRYVMGSRRIRSALVAVALVIMLTITIATLHNGSTLRTQMSKMRRIVNNRGGVLTWDSAQEDYRWRQNFELFGSKELKTLKPLLDNYLNAIRRLRYSLLSANRTWTPVDAGWSLLNGYNPKYFQHIRTYPQISTVLLTADFEVAKQLLPVHKFHDYTGNDCNILTNKDRAIYPNGDELLNKSCQTDMHETLTSLPLDRTILSLGLPFHLSATNPAPTGLVASKVILTFINIVQNGVITSHGVVLSGNVGIMTQRCSLQDYRPVLPFDSEQLPLYDEVLTITQQTLVWYYHGTIEDLPRIAAYLELLRDNPHIKVHITRAGFHQNMLAYLGIGPERIVSGPVRGRIVYLPAGTTCGRPPIFNTQLLAAIFRQRVVDQSPNGNSIKSSPDSTLSTLVKTFDKGVQDTFSNSKQIVQTNSNKHSKSLSYMPLTPPRGVHVRSIKSLTQDTIIIIQRSSPDRQFLNHEAIVAMLRKEAAVRGLQVHVFSDDPLPPLAYDIQLFHRARLIVAPHGAGLANLLFAQPGTAVIEGLCEMEPRFWFCFYGIMPWLCHNRYSRVSLSFRNLATVLGQHYVGVNVARGCLNVQPEDLQGHARFYLDHFS